MTKIEALNILIDFQDWRLGSEIIPMPDVKQITQAIEFAIKELSK